MPEFDGSSIPQQKRVTWSSGCFSILELISVGTSAVIRSRPAKPKWVHADYTAASALFEADES
jgi:hypothetical protein